MIKREDLGSYFISKDTEQVYRMIAYWDRPTVTMRRLEDGCKVDVIADSLMAKDFVKLIPEGKNITVTTESQLYEDLLKVIEPYLSDFTGYDEENQGFNIVFAIKELLEEREERKEK